MRSKRECKAAAEALGTYSTKVRLVKKKKARKYRAGCSWSQKSSTLVWNKFTNKAKQQKKGWQSICRTGSGGRAYREWN